MAYINFHSWMKHDDTVHVDNKCITSWTKLIQLYKITNALMDYHS